MFATWTEAEFLALYQAYQAALLAGSRLIKWTAGGTSVEKSVTLNLADANVRGQIEAEARLRWPDRGGRKRYTRAAARFVN